MSLAFAFFTHPHHVFKQFDLYLFRPISGFAFLGLISPFIFLLISQVRCVWEIEQTSVQALLCSSLPAAQQLHKAS